MNPQADPRRTREPIASAADVEKNPAIDAVAIARLLPEEGGGIVLRSNRDETVVSAETPASGVPVDTATDVPRQKRLRGVDPDLRSLERAQAADASGDVRHHRALIRGVDHE